jgi:hypothetical protein
MNIREPQTELPRDGIGRLLSGGVDLWDEGLVGEILTDEFFEAPAPAGNVIWVNTASGWKQGTLWVKTASGWKTGEPKVNTGTWV